MQNNNRYASTVLLILLVCACSVLLIFLTGNKIKYIVDTNKEIKIEQQAVDSQKLRLQFLQGLEANAAEVQKKYEVLKKLIPDDAAEDQILRNLEIESFDADASFTKVEFKERAQKDKIFEMPLKLSFSGTYDGLMELLDRINKGERLIKINEINMGASEKNSTAIKAEISASSFYTGQQQ